MIDGPVSGSLKKTYAGDAFEQKMNNSKVLGLIKLCIAGAPLFQVIRRTIASALVGN